MNMKKILFALSLSFSCLAFGTTHEEKLAAKLNGFTSMQADFSQVMKAQGEQVSQSKGRMALKRPGQFRWDTQKPMAQLVVADGHNMWIYDVDLEQVTVRKQEKSLGGSAALFLSGYDASVSKNFTVTSSQKGERELFDLHARTEKENFQRIILEFKGSLLSDMTMYDQLDQKTVIHFTHVKNNEKIALNLFSFKPPKGVDVIRQ